MIIRILKTTNAPWRGNYYVQTPVSLWWLNGMANGWLEWISTETRGVLDQPNAELFKLTPEDLTSEFVGAMIKAIEENAYMFYDPLAQTDDAYRPNKIVRMPYNADVAE